MALVARVSMLEPAGDLLRRPQHSKLVGDDACRCPVLRQLAGLGTVSSTPGSLVGLARPITLLPTVALDLAADCGCGSAKKSSDRSDRSTCHHSTRDLFTLRQRQRHLGPMPLRWTDATRRTENS